MQIPSRFTIALHIFSCIHAFEEERKITSDFLADSIGVNPVIIRKMLSQLKGAGLLEIQRGAGGASIAKDPAEITLLDVFCAVDCVEESELFHFHEKPNPNCPVGRNVHNILDGRLRDAQNAMERELESVTVADVLADTDRFLQQEE